LTKSTVSYIESTSMRTFGCFSWISAMAAMPSMPGMEMSVITTSGSRLWTSETSSRPSRASAITSTPSTMESSALMPERTRSWSSASTMRTVLVWTFGFMGAP